LPAAVLNERRKGLQAADWYENMTAAREEIAGEIERLAASPMARSCLDIDRMRRLVADWPSGGWQSPSVVASYRLALLRGIATGRFIRYIEGSNA
jgi:asparagine synthase (glutamine-hydrolysing)